MSEYSSLTKISSAAGEMRESETGLREFSKAHEDGKPKDGSRLKW